jgi:hypothetical protein
MRHSNFLLTGAKPGRLSMADSPLPPWGPIHKGYIQGAGPVRGRAGPGRSGAGPGPGAPYIKYIQGEWGEGVREWGGVVGPGRAGPGPGRLTMGPGIAWP